MKRIVISGYFGFDNIGDEAILYQTIKNLKDNNIQPIVLSKDPQKTSDTYGVESIQRDNFSLVSQVIKESNGLISGGGSLLQDVTSMRNIPYYLLIMGIAHLFNKPIYFHAQGVGPLNKTVSRLMVKTVLKNCYNIAVRDKESKHLLVNELKLKKEVKQIFDPVLFFPQEENVELPSELNEFLTKNPIFLSVKGFSDNQLLEKEIKGFLKEVSKENTPIISIPFHFEQDLGVTKNVLENYPNHLIWDKPLSIQQVAEVIRRSQLVLGMRLHSLILSASQHTPFVGISYDPKIDSFLSQFEQKAIGSMDNLNQKTLLENFYEKTNQLENLKKLIQNKHSEMHEVNKAYEEDLIKKILNS